MFYWVVLCIMMYDKLCSRRRVLTLFLCHMCEYDQDGPSVVIDTCPTKGRYFMSSGVKLSISTRHSVLVSSTTLWPRRR